MRSSDHQALQQEAQAAQAQRRLQERKQGRKAQMKTVTFEPRRKAWMRAFEMIFLQGVAILWAALGVAAGLMLAYTLNW